jgi:signal transduction histidine kinase
MTMVVGYAPDGRGRAVLHLAAMLARSGGDDVVLCAIVPTSWPPSPAKVDAEYQSYLETTAHEALSQARERLPEDLAERAAEMGSLLDRTVTSTRRISADLRPLMLDDLGLADAASWLVEDFAKRSGIQCRYEAPADGGLEGLSKTVATALYRTIQESLTNIARHAGASNAWVQLSVDDGMVQVEVEDDGRGIAPEDLAKARSLGLKGMRERIAYLGGTFEIARAPRGGTRLRLRVPLRGNLSA